MDPLSTLALGGIAVCHLAVADGVDLGIGILFPLAHRQRDRDLLLQGVTPFRRGNEPWLVFGGAMLCVAAPIAYDALPPAFYVPVLAMFSGLIMRGVAHESHFWSGPTVVFVFAGGSFLAALCHGLILGTGVQEALVGNQHLGSGLFGSFSILGFLCAAVVVGGYALLGAVYLYCAQITARASAPIADLMPETIRLGEARSGPARARTSTRADASEFLSPEWPHHRRPTGPSVVSFAQHPIRTRSRGAPAYARTLNPGE